MRRIALLICYCFALSVAHAQLPNLSFVDLSLPVNGAVFQQDNTGHGTIKIVGSSVFLRRFYSFSAFGQTSTRTLTAQLIPLSVATGQPLPAANPITIPLTASTFGFSGSGSVAAGWYEITVYEKVDYYTFGPFYRPRFNSAYNKLTDPIKVGVGEVYIISGQSNAQGIPNNGLNDRSIAQPYPEPTDSDGIRVQPVDVDYNNALGNPNRFNEFVSTQKIEAVKTTYMTTLSSVASLRTDQGIAPAGNSL